VPRLPNTKSTPTLLALSDAIAPVIPRLNEGFTPSTARDILIKVSKLVDASWTWSQGTSDKGGEQKALLGNLLFVAITLLTPSIDAHLFEQWFLRTYPKFGGLHQEGVFQEEGLRALQAALVSSQLRTNRM
jgi:hypothetical protein